MAASRLQGDVDVDVGCSTDEIISKMRETEKLGKRASADAKHLAVSVQLGLRVLWHGSAP